MGYSAKMPVHGDVPTAIKFLPKRKALPDCHFQSKEE
jgi:hypothetical protein